MVSEGWAGAFLTRRELCSAVGSTEVALSKFALIAKTKPDGTVEHRLVWDLPRSGVNSRVRQGERIALPRLRDV
eukprot:2279497-Lingulodinium_polyedra.AAC.1